MKKLTLLALLLPLGPAVAQPLNGDEGFQIVPQSHEKEIYDLYSGGVEPVITTDLVLHTMHLLFDYTLRAVELEKMFASAEELTQLLIGASDKQSAATDGVIREAHRRNVAFLAVALRCLRPDAKIPDYAEAAVKKDLEYIEAHKQFEISEALPHKEDFSQYVPRGHYTRNESFQRYFKAMMWYGRRMFRVEEGDPDGSGMPRDPWSVDHARMETRQALLLAGLLHSVRGALDRWKQIDDLINVFVGEAEDLTAHDYVALANEVYGKMPADKDLLDDPTLDRFIAAAEKRSKPRIDSSGMRREGFQLIPQRSVPDSIITQELVFVPTNPDRQFKYTGSEPLPFTAKETQQGIVRCFPRGLDVMSAFGSDLAREILKSERDDQFEGYDKHLAALRAEFEPKLASKEERRAVYWDWLATVQPLLRDAPEGAPAFMREKAWKRKMLVTSLASWAELRHDTILYVKQSYTGAGKGMPPKPEFAYVEPYPEVYARAGATIARLRKLLEARGAAIPDFAAKYEAFEAELALLEKAARKELKGEALTKEEHQKLIGTPGRLRAIAKLSEAWAKKIASTADASMALVADVHTDNNAPAEVLEEGVGLPSYIRMTVTVNGEKRTFTGGVFTYYEFRWPKSDRLTDEKWQEMLEKGKAPKPPAWVK